MAADPMRLARFLAKAGVASRRQCETLIAAGRVTVNGETVVTPAVNVDPARDRVACDGRPVRIEYHVYYLLHKPPGYTCTASDPHARRRALDLLPVEDEVRLFSVGRLDRDSEGLLLFTNDGELAHRLTHPRFGIDKSYRVEVSGDPRPAGLRQLLAGIEDEGECLRAQVAEVVTRVPGGAVLRIVVSEGRKREIRRMCHYLGLEVRRLQRLRFGPLSLGDLPAGKYRPLNAGEVAALRQAVGLEGQAK